MSDILTAIEQALESTSTETQYPSSPLTGELWRTIEDPTHSPHKVPAMVYVDWNPVRGAYAVTYNGVLAKYTPKTLQMVMEGTRLCTPSAEARLREIEQAIRALYDEMQNFSPQRANDLLYSQAKDLAAKIAHGKVPDQVTLATREQLHTDFRLKRSSIEIAILPLREEAAELARPVITAAKNLVWHHLAALEQDERQLADSYDVPYVPSYHWRALAAAMVKISPDRVRQEVYPSAMLAGFVTF